MRKEIAEKILKLDKFEMVSTYSWDIYIDGTGFRYHAPSDRWYKLREPYVYTYPVADDFYNKIIMETRYFTANKLSSIDEVLETVPDDIKDTILFNINLFR